MKILKQYTGKRGRSRAIAENKYGLLDLDMTNYQLGHKPGINSAIDKTAYFQKQVDEVHGKGVIKICSEYRGSSKKLIVDTGLGKCHTLPKNLLKGFTPSIRTALNPTAYFKKLGQKVHKERYDYSEAIYVDYSSNLKINCKEHGMFMQPPHSHLKGSGCPKCAFHKLANTRLTYTKGIKNAIVYCLKLKETDGVVFYKIGFTRHSIKHRYGKQYCNKQRMPYKYISIFELVFPFKQALVMERELHRAFSLKHYKPQLKFDGSATECYSDIAGYQTIIINNLKT